MFRYFLRDGQNDCPLVLCDRYIGGRFMFTTDWLAAGRDRSDRLDTDRRMSYALGRRKGAATAPLATSSGSHKKTVAGTGQLHIHWMQVCHKHVGGWYCSVTYRLAVHQCLSQTQPYVGTIREILLAGTVLSYSGCMQVGVSARKVVCK